MPNQEISDIWRNFCRRGRYPVRYQEASVKKCIQDDGTVIGYYSGLQLNPELQETDAMYPSHDHLIERSDHGNMVVDARLINDMKTILSEKEFWTVVEHLYAIGRRTGRIPGREAQTLATDWHPARDYA
jgi:hypothetical protein